MNFYCENEVRLSIQPNKYYGKNGNKLLQKQNDMCTQFKKLVRSYVDLENRLKALEDEPEKKSSQLNDSGNKHIFNERNL